MLGQLVVTRVIQAHGLLVNIVILQIDDCIDSCTFYGGSASTLSGVQI
jgi:hypothetical protein